MTKTEAMDAVMKVFAETAPDLVGPTVQQVLLLGRLADMLVMAYESGRASGRAQGTDER